MKQRINWNVSRGVTLALITMGLQACASMSANQPASPQPQASVTAAPQRTPLGQSAASLPAPGADELAERQRLLSQINRDGQALSIPG